MNRQPSTDSPNLHKSPQRGPSQMTNLQQTPSQMTRGPPRAASNRISPYSISQPSSVYGQSGLGSRTQIYANAGQPPFDQNGQRRPLPAPPGGQQRQPQQQALVPYKQQMYHSQGVAQIYQNLEPSKLGAPCKLANIPPVEYVAALRRLSKPVLENKKIVQQMDKLKQIPKKKGRPYVTLGVICLLFSLLMFGIQDSLIRSTMNYVMGELKPNSIVTANWQNVPIPINFCFYLMGLKNGEAFTNGARPYVVETGPFCYLLSRKRRILEWKPNSVRYMERMGFQFDPANSLPLDTKVHMINYPIFIACGFAKNLLETFHISFIGPLVYNGIAVALRLTGESLVDHTTARALLEGKRIAILEYLDLFLKPIRALGVPIPKYFGAGGLQLLNHSFGFTSTLASGEVGPYEVHTRTEGDHLVGDVISFQNMMGKFPTWASPCNAFYGGDGMFWRRPVEAEHLEVFISIACRMVPFVKYKEHYYKGARVLRYHFDPQMFNMSLARNRCFCYKTKRLSDCEGYHDISPCLGWLPVGFSFPHFYQSPNLLEQVDGLEPSFEEHQGFIDFEPLIGAPVNARVGIQGLLDIQPLALVPSLSSVPKHAGADGTLGPLLFLGSNAVRYGSYAWLVGGLGFSGFLFYLANKRRHV